LFVYSNYKHALHCNSVNFVIIQTSQSGFAHIITDADMYTGVQYIILYEQLDHPQKKYNLRLYATTAT